MAANMKSIRDLRLALLYPGETLVDVDWDHDPTGRYPMDSHLTDARAKLELGYRKDPLAAIKVRAARRRGLANLPTAGLLSLWRALGPALHDPAWAMDVQEEMSRREQDAA